MIKQGIMQPSSETVKSAVGSLDSREIYAGPEFKHWVEEEDLIAPERFLLERFLHSDQSTLEAGTGGGRILRALAHRGFKELSGFDNVPELIDQARLKECSRPIAFSVQDARKLTYHDGSFGQLIYLQQVLCFITEAEGRRDAVAEAYRILKPDGLAVFSFLCYESRLESAFYRAIIGYLSVLRTLSRQRRSAQYMPWLWIGSRFNVSAILDRPPHVYWYRFQDAVNLLLHHRFKIVGIGTEPKRTNRNFVSLGTSSRKVQKPECSTLFARNKRLKAGRNAALAKG
jgi:SAM-dependent methyltransferase